jgi:hypothetical protein
MRSITNTRVANPLENTIPTNMFIPCRAALSTAAPRRFIVKPTNILVNEHRIIEQVLNCLERMMERCAL